MVKKKAKPRRKKDDDIIKAVANVTKLAIGVSIIPHVLGAGRG